MGQSTDASICFGVEFDEGFEFPWDNEDENLDFASWWAAQNGFHRPTTDYDSDKEAHQKFWDIQSNLEKECPVELISHCSGDCPMYILAIRGTETTANRGYVETVPELSPQDGNIILDWCKKYDIVVESTPRWLLYSMWY